MTINIGRGTMFWSTQKRREEEYIKMKRRQKVVILRATL